MYHIVFIHLSVGGYLGCFHILAVVNSAAANTGVHASFWITVLSGYMPRLGLLDHMATLTFWGTSMLFSIVAAPACIPTSSVGGLRGGRDIGSKGWGKESSRN